MVLVNPRKYILDPKPDDPCPCGSGKPFRTCCSLRRELSPKQLWFSSRKLATIKARLDEVDAMIDAHPNQPREHAPCRRGCDECCREQIFPISDGEFELIVDYIEHNWTERQKRLLRERVLNTYVDLARNHPGLRDDLAALIGRRAMERREHLELIDTMSQVRDSPCPLLQDGACSVYPARPFACRDYGLCYVPGHVCSLIPEDESQRVWQVPREDAESLFVALRDESAPDGIDKEAVERDDVKMVSLPQPIVMHFVRRWADDPAWDERLTKRLRGVRRW